MAPVELKMNVHCSSCVKKIKLAVKDVRGVKRVWASPEQGLVVVYGTADAYKLRRRLERRLDTPVEIVSDGSEPYYYPDAAAAPHYGPSQVPAYGRGGAPRYYSQPPPPAYYNQPAPARSYPYAAGGYGDGGWADPDPYGYAAHRTVSSFCSIM